jgi:subtilisin family serine protease
MSDTSWRVAVVDGGIDPGSLVRALEIRRFLNRDRNILELEPNGDSTNHGTQIAAIIASTERPLEIIAAQIMTQQGRCTPAAVAAGVHWSLARGARLIHLSLGLRHDRSVLARAIGEAVAADALVVASVPARGEATYPAAYPGVIRATGDARCRPGEISSLATSRVDYGGSATHVSNTGCVLRGASVGAAHVSRFIISHMSPLLSASGVRERLSRLAAYQGPERVSRRGD